LKLLLDTHIWIWSALEPDRLSRSVSKALADPANEIWISPISIWEILLLSQKKRLTLQPDADGFLSDALSRVPLKEATFTHEVALATPQVILHHHDPAGPLSRRQRQGLRTNPGHERPSLARRQGLFCSLESLISSARTHKVAATFYAFKSQSCLFRLACTNDLVAL
jgi:PIN domain nuclease of toxin-antitoxin system